MREVRDREELEVIIYSDFLLKEGILSSNGGLTHSCFLSRVSLGLYQVISTTFEISLFSISFTLSSSQRFSISRLYHSNDLANASL
jgi:hypothetical protein